MAIKISASDVVRKEVDKDVRSHFRNMLGRLRRKVAHIEVVLDKDNEEAVNSLHTCVLRLRLHRASDVLIMARGSDFSGVLKRAFRLARYELIRRPRKRRPMFARTQPALS